MLVAGRVRKVLPALLVIYALVVHDGGDPLLGTYRGPGFSVGYPAGWNTDDAPGLVPPSVMVAGPFGRSLPALSVGARATHAAQAAADYAKSLAPYDDLALERGRVAVHGGPTGYLLHARYSQISTDNERVPFEETILFAEMRQGRALVVQFSCAPGQCAPRTVQAVMSSVMVNELPCRLESCLRNGGRVLRAAGSDCGPW